MILYSYMHWFWITCYIYVTYCQSVRMHSNLTEINKNVTVNINNTLVNEVQESSNDTNINIPTKYVESSGNNNNSNNNNTPTTDLVTKASKGSYKNLMKLNLMKKVTTVLPSSRKMPVIDEDTKIDSFNSSNQTIINVYNQTENITFTKDELYNQSNLHNFEQIKKDGDVPVISAAGIVGITLGCVTIIASVIFVSFVIYRNRGLNRPQVLNDHCSNLDSSGYIDDASVRDNSEEMYSLDNDSFLNSLEAMTIQNYWTDTVKHTKL